MSANDNPQRLGWKEWVALPALGIPAVKAKIDTGARTSALHTFSLKAFRRNGILKVRFGIHPLQRRTDLELFCEADVLDHRRVKDSGGHVEKRYVILTTVALGGRQWPIEVTLTNRDTMMFRMLLGRTALGGGRYCVSPDEAYLTGRKLGRTYFKGRKPARQASP